MTRAELHVCVASEACTGCCATTHLSKCIWRETASVCACITAVLHCIDPCEPADFCHALSPNMTCHVCLQIAEPVNACSFAAGLSSKESGTGAAFGAFHGQMGCLYLFEDVLNPGKPVLAQMYFTLP